MTTIIINGEEVPAALISDLPEADEPSRDHMVPVQGARSDHLTVAQILALIQSGDLEGKIPSSVIHGADAKAAPVNADEMALADSADGWKLKKLTWANIKAILSSVFLTLGGAGQQTMTRRTTFKGSKGGIAVVEWGGEQIEIAADTASDVAFVTFHIPGIAAANFGMGADSQFRRGGKGIGAVSHLLWDHGNVNVGSFSMPNGPSQPGHVATKYYVDTAVAAGGGLGFGQSWQDVAGSRASNTVYQNTTGKPIQLRIFIPGTGGGILKASADGMAWATLGRANTANDQYPTIPPGHYYQVEGGAFNGWTELR